VVVIMSGLHAGGMPARLDLHQTSVGEGEAGGPL
jgi:hypothetical protein